MYRPTTPNSARPGTARRALNLLILILATGLGWAGAQVNTFAAEDGSFTLRYPAAWTIEEGALLGQGGTGFVLLSDPELIDAPTEEAFALVLGEVFANPGPDFAEAAVANMFGDEDFTPTSDAVVTETEEGQRITQTFSGTQDGVDVSLTLTFVVSGEWVKAFVSVMNSSGLETLAPAVEAVLASFTLDAEVEAGVDTSANVDKASEATESMESNVVEGVETFTAEDGSFTLSYPANWTMDGGGLMASLEGVGFTLLSDPKLDRGPIEEAFAAVTGRVFLNPAPGFAEAVVKRALAAEGFTPVGEAELVRDDGGYRVVQSLTHEDDADSAVEVIWTLTLFANENLVGAFISAMNASGQEAYGPAVDTVLASVELAETDRSAAVGESSGNAESVPNDVVRAPTATEPVAKVSRNQYL